MASDLYFIRHYSHIAWIVGALLVAGIAGWCFAAGYTWLGVVAVVAALFCSCMLMKEILMSNRKLKYVLDATLHRDFSYSFPVDSGSKYQRSANRVLNRLVEHFEHLTNEIRQNEAFLTRVINLTDIGMIVADADGHVVMHNESALQLLRRPALTHICQIPPQSFSILSVKTHSVVLCNRKMSIYTLADMQQPLQTAEVESWENLTRVLTHEIMNSLTPVGSIADTMTVKAKEPEVRDAFATIASSSISLMNFVKNFRKFSLLPEVKMSAEYLKPLLERCVKMAEAFAGRDKVRIETICFPPDLMVYTDESLLSRVIINLLKNAVEASANVIRVDARILPDESVEIRIANDGELIEDEIARQIFTPFFTTRPSGSGIGLSLSRRIITHLGGTLTLQTRPHTSFAIRL